MLRYLPAFALAGLSQFASALVIDDFATGPQLLRLSTGSATSIDPAPGAVGGHRLISLNVVNNAFGNDATARVNGGVFSHNDEAGVYSESAFGYGYLGLLNLDLSGQDRFRLHFLEADHAVNLNIVVYSLGGASYASFGVNLPPSNAPFQVDALYSSFSAFSAGGGFDDIDVITVLLQRASGGATASDLAIDLVEAVPEPTSAGAVALGLAALAARRKRTD